MRQMHKIWDRLGRQVSAISSARVVAVSKKYILMSRGTNISIKLNIEALDLQFGANQSRDIKQKISAVNEDILS